MIRAFQFELPKLTERMRNLIKQRKSDQTKTPEHVNAHVPPAVFFSLTRDLGVTIVTNDISAVCYFDPSDPEISMLQYENMEDVVNVYLERRAQAP